MLYYSTCFLVVFLSLAGHSFMSCFPFLVILLEMEASPSFLAHAMYAKANLSMSTDYRAFEQMSSHISCKTTRLTSAKDAASIIDDTLVAMLTEVCFHRSLLILSN